MANEEYSILALLIKLSELRDANDRISMDDLAKLALDLKVPQSIFEKMINELTEYRDDVNRRAELMNRLPGLTDELNQFMEAIKRNDSTRYLETIEELHEFYDRFDAVTGEIDEINKRIKERQGRS